MMSPAPEPDEEVRGEQPGQKAPVARQQVLADRAPRARGPLLADAREEEVASRVDRGDAEERVAQPEQLRAEAARELADDDPASGRGDERGQGLEGGGEAEEVDPVPLGRVAHEEGRRRHPVHGEEHADAEGESGEERRLAHEQHGRRAAPRTRRAARPKTRAAGTRSIQRAAGRAMTTLPSAPAERIPPMAASPRPSAR